MKIGILTHPLTSNYGGILQCYALNLYLQKLGHETIVIDRRHDKDFFLWRWIRSILKAFHFSRYYKPTTIDKTVKIREFVNNKFNRTNPIDSQSKMKRVCDEYGLDAVIVGSDQVWRAEYAMNFGYNYFLDFVPDNVIKASYAASFGLSGWQYTSEQTKQIKKLLTWFKAISVREDEGVELIKDKIGLEPQHLLDPTMLLSSDDYSSIVAERQVSEPYIFVYWLGDKTIIQPKLEGYKQKGIRVIDIKLRDNAEQHSVEEWLSLIKYADQVVTDSFHGCVFSTIFNVPFIIYSNESGGNGRLYSLFNQLGLEDKLSNPEADIDYSVVNETIKELQEHTTLFINNLLPQ